MNTDGKICNNCQYFRMKKWQGLPNAPEPSWCSNSKSPNFWKSVGSTDSCKAFQKRPEGQVDNTEELSQRANQAINSIRQDHVQATEPKPEPEPEPEPDLNKKKHRRRY